MGALKTENALLHHQQHAAEKQAEETKQQFKETQDQARNAFRALAGDALKESSKQFLQLASERLKAEQAVAGKELEVRKKEVEALVKPLGEALNKYNTSVQQIEKARGEAYGSLKTQVAAMTHDQRRLRDETARLVTSLRRPEVRGRWGEMQLKRVAELAGMIENCDFTEQASVSTGSGTQRPDMVVHLPSGRSIIVDAKTPLDAFISAIECDEDDDQRAAYYQQHAAQVETQIKTLAAKQYTAQFASTPEFVVLFIPGESFLQAAAQVRPNLFEDAMKQGVIIASPSTLVALLKAVAVGWREQRIAENARRISELGKELHKRLGTAFEHVAALGSSLDKSVSKYNALVGSLQTSVLPQAKRFQEMGADSHKQLPDELKPIDLQPRAVSHEIKIMTRNDKPEISPAGGA